MVLGSLFPFQGAKVLKKNEKTKFYLRIPKKSSTFVRFFG